MITNINLIREFKKMCYWQERNSGKDTLKVEKKTFIVSYEARAQCHIIVKR